MSIRIISPGPFALIQDRGRPGAASWGLGPGGALDKYALLAANRLVGNPDSAAGLEILIGGFVAEFDRSTMVAVTGAHGPITLDGVPVPGDAAIRVATGARLSISPAHAGLRFYLAVSGGVLAEPLAGSLSRDVLAEMGPAPLRAGESLSVGEPVSRDAAEELPAADRSVAVFRDPPVMDRPLSLRVTPGPRLNWFAAGSWQMLTGQLWTVAAESNRIGVRLSGRALEFAKDAQLPSEGMVTGALQVPPSGLPTVFLADHPVTGGYPVIAVVRRTDLDLLGQAAPGQIIRFLSA